MSETSRGRLGVAALAAATNTVVYEVTNARDANVDIFVCNVSKGDAKVRIAIVNGAVGALATEDYVVYDKVLKRGQYIEIKDVDMDGDEAVVAYSDVANVVVRVSGTEQTEAAGINAEELTASGAVTPGVNSIELNHATVAIAATIATLVAHEGLLNVKFTGAGIESHTVTATVGTFDGTNNIMTLNAHDDSVVMWIDSAGNGLVLLNAGTVVLSS
ncbi:MAG: hypothetical protein PF440_05830 [Thiomicrorhabdus sp.]|jgi:hypothetical protein|nr:hypothetical protein [Thiomicrorhabdus sp.]